MKEAFKIISKKRVFKNMNLPSETVEILLQDFYENHGHFEGFVKELKSVIKSCGREIVIQEANKIKEQNKKKELIEIRNTLKGFAEELLKN